MSKTEPVEVKSKKAVVGTFDYVYPEDLEEAIEMDGAEKVFKLYAQARKIRFSDAKRREATSGESAVYKQLKEKLKDASPEKVKEMCEMLGVEID